MPAPHHSIFNRPDALPDTKPTVSSTKSKEDAVEKIN